MNTTELAEIMAVAEKVCALNERAVERMRAMGFEHDGAVSDLLLFAPLSEDEYHQFVAAIGVAMLKAAHTLDVERVSNLMHNLVLLGVALGTMALTSEAQKAN